jgi:thiol-disulfide isomerase/thioredoxin
MRNLPLLILPLVLNCSNVYAVEEGQPSPACPAVLTETSTSVDPNTFKGKVVLIDFWATWCPPCLKSMPFFNGLRNELLKNGFEIVAINVDEDSETARQFLQSHPVDYKMAFDPKGECPKIFDVKGMPSSYLIDKKGVVRKIHIGYRESDQTQLREHIQALLGE